MAFTGYNIVAGPNPSAIAVTINNLLGAGYAPLGGPFLDLRGQLCQAMVQGDGDIPATSAVVANGATVVVHNSAGATIAGTHTAEVAANALTDVKLASTVAAVTNTQQIAVAPTGTYTAHTTFTVVNGVITAIALS